MANAIISGDAEPAYASFFPLVAYQQVKDVAKPERDYKFRLLANFKRDVLEYHHALGEAAAQAKLEGITVSEKDAKWMEPGSEGNRLGYFRVLRSQPTSLAQAPASWRPSSPSGPPPTRAFRATP